MAAKLTASMADALVALVASSDDPERQDPNIGLGTLSALERRGLAESRLDESCRIGINFLWRRTPAGDDVALQISLDREAVAT